MSARALVFAMVLSTAPSAAHTATIAATAPLPTHVTKTVPLGGNQNLRVESYVVANSSGHTSHDLAVIVGAGTHANEIWHRSLPEAPAHLSSTIPGVFVAIGPASTSAQSFVAAYHVSGHSVSSAIAGVSAGSVTANRGARSRSGGFVVMNADAAHTGAIPYRVRVRYGWSNGAYREQRRAEIPDLAPSAYPVPNAVIHAASGSTALLKLQVAADQASQDQGLMFLKSMNADQGMVFVWTNDVQESFWMENTYIPLTVAFISATGAVQETQDMAPLTTDYHTPALPYRYAIEANVGYFAKFGIRAGDQVDFHLGS